MIGLTSLTTNGRPLVAPKLNRRRALFVLLKIDEILGWEKAADQERDSRFVDLGRYLCEVRSGQYWRLDNLKSFDLPAPLATPIVALEDSMTELAIRLDFKPLSRPLPFESVQGCSSRCPATGASVSREERPLAE